MTDPQWVFGQGYELLATFPAGAGGAIWLVRSQQDGAERAIKILRPELTSVAAAVDEFRALLDSVRGLAHPGLPVADETVVHGNRVALVMGRMPGEDLRALLDRRGVTPASTVLVVADLCDALATAHAAGIVHGDVKPSNVLVELDPESAAPRAVRLTDIGIAALAARSGVVVLPAKYQAPETDAEQQLVTPASDIYAVGAVLYEALAGRPPVTGAHAEEIRWLHRDAQPTRVPALPDQLWLLVAACLAEHPMQRPTASELAELLREIAPTIVALPALATQDTARIARIPVSPAPKPATPASSEPVVSAVIVPIEATWAEQPAVPRRSVFRGPRGITLAVLSGAVAFSAMVAFVHASGGSAPGALTLGSATSPALTFSDPSGGFTSTVTTTLTPAAAKKGSISAAPTPSPDADSQTASATSVPSASTVPSSASANGSTAPATAPALSATPSATASTPTAGPVTVAWQCATNEVRSASISKTACIGIGSDGALYIRGTSTASNGQTISDIKVSLADNGQYSYTTSESCGTSSCSITGGPYSPAAGTYQALSGIDGSTHNEFSPSIAYPGA
jgi:serine/threonine-protein kinase